MLEGNVTIKKEEYFKLRMSDEILERLYAGGVGDWEWYDESINPAGEVEIDQFEEDLKKEIKKM